VDPKNKPAMKNKKPRERLTIIAIVLAVIVISVSWMFISSITLYIIGGGDDPKVIKWLLFWIGIAIATFTLMFRRINIH